MSNKPNLLQSAIADAKMVKEVAMLNAKKSIEESFAPHLKSMLSSRIQEMEDEESNEAKNDLESMLEPYGSPEEIKSYMEHIDADKDEYKEWASDDIIEDFKYWIQDKMDSALEEGPVEEEFDLDELLKEMSDEEIPTNPTDPNDNLVCEDEDKEDTEDDKNEDTEDTDEDDEEIDLDNLSEDDLRDFVEDVIKSMVEDGELEAGEDNDLEGDEELDLDLDTDDLGGDEEESEELAEVKSQLFESKKTISNLTKQLNESNLLNAKLLYTNRIYKSKVLTEDKKTRVLEAFDKAGSVKEVKLTYELLKENLSSTPVKTSRSSIKGFASKPMVIKENKSVTPILEDEALFRRMQKLAGL